MDFSVVSGSVGLWKPLPHLLWTERTGIGARFWVRLTILLLRTAYLILPLTQSAFPLALAHFCDSSSLAVFIMPQHNSHSVLV